METDPLRRTSQNRRQLRRRPVPLRLRFAMSPPAIGAASARTAATSVYPRAHRAIRRV